MSVAPSPAARDRRGPAEIGTHAALELTFGVRNGRTALLHSYAEPPLRAGRCIDTGHGVHLILASSAPGLFGGDAIEQTISLEPGTRVSLASQSALQLHPSAAGSPVSIRSRYDVAEGAELRCVWDPAIPFAGAVVQQRIEINIARGGRLMWSDALMGGREGRGERWQFGRLDHELRLQTGARLGYLERYRLEPSLSRVTQPWAAGDMAYIGTLLRFGHGDDGDVAERLHAMMAAAPDVRGSADVIEGDLLLVRIAAADGVAFHRMRQAVLMGLPG